MKMFGGVFGRDRVTCDIVMTQEFRLSIGVVAKTILASARVADDCWVQKNVFSKILHKFNRSHSINL